MRKNIVMKKFFLVFLFIAVLAISDSFSQNRKIQFVEKPWQEILETARKENKLIFLDAFASWCGPCKWMAANIFTNDSIADYFNNTFICVSIDMEKGDGVQLRNKYQVRYYPSLLFINAEGEMVHEKVGAARTIQDYISMGKIALDPNENLSSYLNRYNAGESSEPFFQTLLLRLADAYLPVQPVLQKYFSGRTDAEMLSGHTWSVINNFVNDMNMPQFDYLVKHQHEYGKLIGKDSVDNKISGVYMNSLMKQTRSSQVTDSLLNQLRRKILESGFDGAAKVVFTFDLDLYQMHKQNVQFLDLAFDKLDNYYSDDSNVLNSVAWYVFKICSDNSVRDSLKYLNKAVEWARKSVSLKSEPANNDTYASLLFATGHRKEAISFEQVAITLAKEQSLPVNEYETTLKKMENPQETKNP